MSDELVRALSASGGIRLLACSIPGLAAEVCGLQGCSATTGIAMGRGLSGGVLMGALLKPGQRVALKFEGNGPLGKLIIEADSDGAVRGSAGNPAAEADPVEGRWNVAGLLGKAGFLTVSKDLGLGGAPYQGMVQLVSSEIGDDLAYYLTDSEQVPSAVGLGAALDDAGRIGACGGFLAQALPKASDTEIEEVMAAIAALPPITEVLRQGGPKLLIERAFGGVAYNLLETRPAFFRCGCSEEKVERALLSLGREELEHLLQEREEAQVTCEFCRRRYDLGADAVRKLISVHG